MVDYKNMDLDFIIDWCEENEQVEWLKKTAAKQVSCKVYPKVKGEDGKMRADKTQKPSIEKRPISYIQIKNEFVKKFMPELLPKKASKVSMYDRIKAL